MKDRLIACIDYIPEVTHNGFTQWKIMTGGLFIDIQATTTLMNPYRHKRNVMHAFRKHGWVWKL